MTGMDRLGIDLPTEVAHTDRLGLRPFREDDIEPVLAACQSPDIARWIAAIGVPYTREDAVAFVTGEAPRARREGTGLTVAIEADGVLVGSSGVHRIGQHPLGREIGYWIAPEARGNGYAAEAAHALAEWAIGLGAPGCTWSPMSSTPGRRRSPAGPGSPRRACCAPTWPTGTAAGVTPQSSPGSPATDALRGSTRSGGR